MFSRSSPSITVILAPNFFARVLAAASEILLAARDLGHARATILADERSKRVAHSLCDSLLARADRGLDTVIVEFPGALFMSAGGYHHHLGTNTWAAGALAAADGDARLIEWTVVLPSTKDVAEAAQSIADAGFQTRTDGSDAVTVDPWGTGVRLTTG